MVAEERDSTRASKQAQRVEDTAKDRRTVSTLGSYALKNHELASHSLRQRVAQLSSRLLQAKRVLHWSRTSPAGVPIFLVIVHNWRPTWIPTNTMD